MAQFTVRQLEDDVKQQLQARAAAHGVSMEEEVRRILRAAVMARPEGPQAGLGSRMAARFSRCGLTADEDLAALPAASARPASFD
jgi:plasmid stability protein